MRCIVIDVGNTSTGIGLYDNGKISRVTHLRGGIVKQPEACAEAVRKAAQGKRRQTVRFARPLDPRWEIGSVLAVSAYGVAATGQVVEFDESLDHDSGLVESTYRLACPAGSGTTTGYTASVTPPGRSTASGGRGSR